MSNYRLLSLILSLFLLILWFPSTAENGYDLWLRYQPIENQEILAKYQSVLQSFSIDGDSETIEIIRIELQRGLSGLLNSEIAEVTTSPSLQLKLAAELKSDDRFSSSELSKLHKDGFIIKASKTSGIIITSPTEVGLLYGAFHFLRLLQTNQEINNLNITENPKVDIRMLNHWDNLDRTSERGYAGFSIWDWHKLPGYLDQRYIDYARANASIGINGSVLTNVNSNALILTPAYLEKVKALADLFRPYGIKIYLTARFSAPVEIGGLKTADPLDADVQNWWNEKVKEIYTYIPDFGGLLVKANSEGQPGPQNYNRTHADGANMMARALKPYNGIVMWRAFVYSNEEPVDRAMQAYNEFKALDSKFDSNVIVQVKNGPIDFQPREPFHPLFGATPKTPLMMEFQITQEYLGQATQMVYLAPMYKECLESDTYAKGRGSEVSKVIDGSLFGHDLTGIAGVANIGTDINWTGHPMAQSNWYAFGRLTWNHSLSSEEIAEEWVKMTFGNSEKTITTICDMLLKTWETTVSYMTPLGLNHIMATGHHYGPGPWVDYLPRADWNPVYFHRADKEGIGFDRTKSGSNAVAQYAIEVAEKFGSRKKVPEKFLLWFHHVGWDEKMKSGRPLWDELAWNYQDGVNGVRTFKQNWNSLKGEIDDERYQQVNMLLDIQLEEAIWWKDACMVYFQTFSQKPFPDFLEKPTHDLEYFKKKEKSTPFAPGIRPQW